MPTPTSTSRAIVVLGGSAGSIQVIQQILSALPADFPAAIAVVVHQAQSTPGTLPRVLGQHSALPATHAVEGETIEAGHVYVAPPDRHLLIELEPGSETRPPGGGAAARVRLSAGPKENRFRPAIDPTFRTAARVFGRRTVGVVLSGLLDDGTLGVMRVKQFGGIAIAQDPNEALCADMPASAIRHAPVDFVATSDQIATLLLQIVTENFDLKANVDANKTGGPAAGSADLSQELSVPAKGLSKAPPAQSISEPQEPGAAVPDTLRGAGIVVDVVQRGDRGLSNRTMSGSPMALTCPQCGGAIWEQDEGEMIHFRCHVGHRFTADTFAVEQSENLESTLWAALRMFEEKVLLHRRMAQSAENSQNHYMAMRFGERAEESTRQAEVIRRLLLGEPQQSAAAGRPAFDTPAAGAEQAARPSANKQAG